MARLTTNLPSQAGREDWWPVKLTRIHKSNEVYLKDNQELDSIENWQAEPIFGKSNLIFTLINANGLLRISPEITGLSAGERVEVVIF